jgi:nucleoside-diphosphate-sugar epimerase
MTALLDRGYLVVAQLHQKDLPLKTKNRCERVLLGNICDLSLQQDMVQDVQVVCHLAAHIPTQHMGLQEAARCYSINAQATLELATMASEEGVRRFVHFSAGNMYANYDRPCAESDRIFPAEYATDYMVSKLAAEIYLTNISQRLPMEVVILRIGTPYGLGEPSKKVIPTFLRFAAQGRPLHLVNGGVATYNFVFVADVADLAMRAIEGGSQGIYNVASGEHTSLLELASAIVDLYSERDVPLNIEPATKGTFPGVPAISIDKARKAFGFSPRSLAVGLREYRASLAKDENQP